MTAFLAACWLVANILLVCFNERAIVSFPGAWIIVGLR